MISTIRLPENDDSAACDSIFQIGHLLGNVNVNVNGNVNGNGNGNVNGNVLLDNVK